ncbi:MAG TPA: hypothetical protein VIM70_12255 [Clostridium sp.]|uniref:hypothetical protein n=1 Tax=Clostridium sp. TaxID=1506 RepID=UPI002F934FAC
MGSFLLYRKQLAETAVDNILTEIEEKALLLAKDILNDDVFKNSYLMLKMIKQLQ